MDKSLYSRRSNLVIGFHGCDKSVVDAVVAGKTDLLSSTNDYDWLGNGIYFWENNEERAWQWAKDLAKKKELTNQRACSCWCNYRLGVLF